MRLLLTAALLHLTCTVAFAQPLGEPDRQSPGDRMIQEYLREDGLDVYDRFGEDLKSLEDWENSRERYLREYFYMLGLWPMPEKTPLHTTVTGTLDRGDYLVEKLHYQSRPGLYVTGNLYRPKEIAPGERLPAILYVCGHSNRGRNGNKTAYQSHGIWFARHGYVCLTVDTLQLGEIAAIHHGTYRENRWWWHSRGYTPAGVECWNGIRGIDYLLSRDDVDADRIGVTGISGGGGATVWIAAADERVKAAVPVSGMSDLLAYVPNRVINGHCDCMFLYNTYRWPWARIGALIAPRPMLFVNSDADSIFPMDGNERVINRFERIYSLYGAGDRVDSLVSVGGHAYREDIRKASFRFMNIALKNDSSEITDSEIDLVTDRNDPSTYPIPQEELRVFPTDADIPKEELNTTIDRHFVPMADVSMPQEGRFDEWKSGLLGQLRDVSLRTLPERVPKVRPVRQEGNEQWLETEANITIPIRRSASHATPQQPRRIVLVLNSEDEPSGEDFEPREGDDRWHCDVRGIVPTRWTIKNPPNYVERSLVLLGRTVASGRIRDVAAVARLLKSQAGDDVPLVVAGKGEMGIVAAYAALVEPEIDEVIAVAPPASHMDAATPPLLNVLRVCDIPHVLGMLAPRRLTLDGAPADLTRDVRTIYAAADAEDALTLETNR